MSTFMTNNTIKKLYTTVKNCMTIQYTTTKKASTDIVYGNSD